MATVDVSPASREGLYGGAAPTSVKEEEAGPWLKLAKDAYSRSTNYFDNNYKQRWEDDLRMFQSKHPRDSKYISDNYKYRSRIFRPKSRSVIRKNEATAALAFFSNPDVVSIDPQNQDDKMQVASSIAMKELLQYRLTKTIPWFLTVIGGFQDAMTVGLVASMQLWRYKAKEEMQVRTVEHPELGAFQMEVPSQRVIEDKPCVELIPVENIRFDPAAHWYDIVETSPYLIVQMPMYVNDVLDNMESPDRSGATWKPLAKATILQARVAAFDSLRQARNDNREDAEQVTSEVNEFDVVMVHLNFIKTGGETYAYYTLKDIHLLSEPMLLADMFLHCKSGRPPVQVGFCVIETHKAVPSSLIGLGSELQKEANEVANQRLDNVKYVLNKRSMVRRGANVDIESLLRNVPGGVTMVNDVERDVREVSWPDVTSSSYQEQDRINVDFDELLGNFAQGSVMTNRKLNETVGGMRIMAQGANMLTEYTIRVFVETWVEPVLRELIRMEAAYETDEVVLATAAERAQLFQRFGMNQITDSLLRQDLTLSVSVGMGATDPTQRTESFLKAMGAYSKMAVEGPPDMNLPEIRKVLFGLSGFKDSSRFFKDVDPQVAKAEKMMGEAEEMAKQYVEQRKDAIVRREAQQDDRDNDLALERISLDTEKKLFEMQKNADASASKMEEANADIAIQVIRAELDDALKARGAMRDMTLKEEKAAQDMLIKELQAKLDMLLKKQAADQDRMLKAMAAAQAAANSPKEKRGRKDPKTGDWVVTERNVN